MHRCRHCSRAVFADHGLSVFNLVAHEGACLEQQARLTARVAKQASVKWRRDIRRSIRESGTSVGSSAVPCVGQLGFPFPGVPEEVT